MPLGHGQTFPRDAFCLGQLSLIITQQAERDHALRHWRRIEAVEQLALLQARIQQSVCLIEFSQFLINRAKRLVEIGLHFWFRVERLRLLDATVKESHNAKTFRRRGGSVAALEEIGHEFLYTLRSRGFGKRGITSDGQSHSEENHKAGNEREHKCRRSNRLPIPCDEFSKAVGQRVRLRF